MIKQYSSNFFSSFKKLFWKLNCQHLGIVQIRVTPLLNLGTQEAFSLLMSIDDDVPDGNTITSVEKSNNSPLNKKNNFN